MSEARYGVLRGRIAGSPEAGSPERRGAHVRLPVRAGRRTHEVAVNVASGASPHELLYLVDYDYRHDALADVRVVAEGFHPLACEARGAALDYVRDRLFDTARLRPLPKRSSAANDLELLLDELIARAIEDRAAEVFAFGRGRPVGAGVAMRDVHMNQGSHADLRGGDGVYQDGALFFHFPEADRWAAVFLAFQSQSFRTGPEGHAVDPPQAAEIVARLHQPMAPLGASLQPSAEVLEARAADALAIPLPVVRPLRVYAFDPSRGRRLGNELTLNVRYHALANGAVETRRDRDRIAVVDYDASNDQYYAPVDLDDPSILIRDGLDPTESDPRFHQQMVYAVATETVEHFETALGRKIHWRRGERAPGQRRGWTEDDILALQLFPHAMHEANAFYSPDAHGILFGYFRADRDHPGSNLPGQPVFTCLSRDIVVHEMTHAILDGQRAHFIEQTNEDVAAFHEAIADLAALFRHFSHREVLLDTLQRTGGELYQFQLTPDASSPSLVASQPGTNPLVELALQFGDAAGLRRGLRQAIGPNVDPKALASAHEPHARGSILVAAVFDAFFSLYVKRTSDLFRVFRAGGGQARPMDLPQPLAELLCTEAMRTADYFFRACVRAIDYCPPVDITFGDFLRALITAVGDFDETDEEGVRDILMRAFQRRGILPDGARFFSVDALAWPRGRALGLPPVSEFPFGDPNSLNWTQKEQIKQVLLQYVSQRRVMECLDLDPRLPVAVPSFHPVFRVQRDGSLRTDLVAEVVQTMHLPVGARQGRHPFRGGATLILSEPPPEGELERTAVVRYVVKKHLRGTDGDRRMVGQRAFMERQGLFEGQRSLRIDFGLVHAGRV